MYLSDFFLGFSSQTACFEMLVTISLGSSSEPLDLSQISLRHIQYIDGHCNFTHDCVPPSHQFINNFALHSATQGEFITHTDTPVEPLPQFHANRFTDKNVVAKEMSQDECLLHLFFCPPFWSVLFPCSLKRFLFPCSLRYFVFVPLFPS